ncbi:hypothetical protein OIO90_001547 [Microbotryomycetes sp. JL221]|nr:hypothetical protein OIO90_001547 [Microbotryomycetes sp. JL221]
MAMPLGGSNEPDLAMQNNQVTAQQHVASGDHHAPGVAGADEQPIKKTTTASTKSDDKQPKSKKWFGNKSDKNKDDKTPTAPTDAEPDMSNLTAQQRDIVTRQIYTPETKPVNYFLLYRYATKYELALNAIGLLCAIAAGTTQPLLTVVFAGLTNSFNEFGRAVGALDGTPAMTEAFEQAKANLKSEVSTNVLYLVYIGIGMLVTTYIYMGAFVYTGELSTRRIRERYLEAVLRQNVAWFDKTGTGEITNRIENDTHLVQEGISEKIPIMAMYTATFFAGFVVAFVQSWRLTLVLICIVPLIAGVGGVMEGFSAKYKKTSLDELSIASSLSEEVFSSVRNAHAFGTQRKLTALYDFWNLKAEVVGRKFALTTGLGLSGFFFIIYSAYALAFFAGSRFILQGYMDAGGVIGTFLAVLIGAFSLSELAPKAQAVAFAMAAGSKLFTTIDRVPSIDSSSPEGLRPESCTGMFELENVDAIYPSRPNVQVLFEFNGMFPPGKMTALVGGSGSGKSTIIALLERFYDPVGGVIKLDGVPIKDLNLRWLRSQIGLVSQEPTLFAGTVAENIAYGLIDRFEEDTPQQRRERIIEAAKKANAHGFVSALPEGYETLIGERGMLLSGGQKQRIGIARAIIGDPKILLLDEATSALDTASEAIVQEALDRASAGRTTIAIAHRLSTIKNADQIIVMTAGKMIESAMTNENGSAHSQLLQNPDGGYSKLVAAQKFREEAEAEEGDSSSSSTDVGESEKIIPGELTHEQAAKLAEEEKPQFLNLKRTGTGKSIASEVLGRRIQEEEGLAQRQKKPGFFYIMARMINVNSDKWWEYLIVVICSAAVGAVYPSFSFILGKPFSALVFVIPQLTECLAPAAGALTDLGSADRSQISDGGHKWGLWSFVIAIIAAIAVGIQCFFAVHMAEVLARSMRVNTFAATLRQDIVYFDRDENSTGFLTSRVGSLATKTTGLFGVTGAIIVQNCFTIIIGSIIALCFAWRLALVSMSLIPLNLLAGFARLYVVEMKDEANKKSHAASAQMACESAAAIRTVASLRREEGCSRTYSEALDEPQARTFKTALTSNFLYAVTQALAFWVIGLIFWYGAQQLADGAISVREYFIALIAVTFASIEAGAIFSYVPDVSKSKGAALEYIHLVDARPTIDAEEPSGEKLSLAEYAGEKATCGRLTFKDVHFRYPTRPHVRVLRGLNLEVPAGSTVAIVGPSGSGKSTIVQLVERFYDPLAGEVQIDGQDISSLNVESYRSNVALVSQEPTLYAGTVKFNITLGALKPAEQVTQAEIEQACKDANIHDFIMSLPDGYETEVGGKGTQLSGGQKQRVAIARALIRNPRVLLLDEATAALDSQSERVVQAALDKASKGRSTIAVAHRLSTIQNADVIYVLKDGQVAERGTHHELLAKRGIYFELVLQQSLEKDKKA